MQEYGSRINRVIDYIEKNLDQPLTLNQLAEVACFSAFHFHRIFHTYTGERPFEFIQRLRLEKAANLLISRKERKIIDIALLCGFSNAPAFSRAFKEKFKCSPSVWRQKSSEISNFSIFDSNIRQAGSAWIPYIEYHQGVQLWRMRSKDQERWVEVKMLEPMRLAYIRYTGRYKGDGQLFNRLWNKLFTIAGANGLIENDSRYIAIYHHNPELTSQDKLRVTVAASTRKEFDTGGKLSRMELEGGKYAFIHFRLNSSEYQEAWDWSYREWLPRSGYNPDDRPAFELFHRDGEKSTDGRYPVIICIPLVAVS